MSVEAGMRWWIAEVDPKVREGLAHTARHGAPPAGGLFHYQSLHRPGLLGKLLFLGLFGVTILGLLLYTAIQANSLSGELVAGGFLAGAATWTALLFAELIRGARSDVKPFLLVTPKMILRSDYAHGVLLAQRLKDATKFNAVERYHDESQKYLGRNYTITFPAETVSFRATGAHSIDRLEEVLEAARAGSDDPRALELFPGADPSPSTTWRSFTNPLGIFWIALGGILAALIVVVFIVAHALK